MSSEIETFIYSLNFTERKWEYAVACLLLFATGITVKQCRKYLCRLRLKKKREGVQKRRNEEFKRYESSLAEVSGESVNEICQQNAEEIVRGVRQGSYSSQEVLQAFQCKALESQKKTNCVVGFVNEAESFADGVVAGNSEQLLCGLPVSIKENFSIKGYDITVGCSEQIGNTQPDDCVMVKVLKHQGAIPFVRTNVPQTLLSWETSNPIFGYTRNPHDLSRTTGGSSGGEAALIVSGGSVLGWGSDIGGSIRIPAALCGIYGLKCTAGRISSKGTSPLMKGQTMVKSTFGPMARDMDSLVLGARAMMCPKMWELDPTVVPLPFNAQVFKEKRRLRIGYYLDDNYMTSVPAMRRGVRETVQLLQEMGHTVEEWKLPKDFMQTVGSTWLMGVMGDSGQKLRDVIGNEHLDMAMKSLEPLIYLPKWLKRSVARVFPYLGSFFSKLSLTLKTSCGCESVAEWWKWNEKAQGLRQQLLEEWEQHGFDAMICPGFACPAAPIGTSGQCPGASTYTMLYNLVEFPAGTLPVTTVSPNDELTGRSYPTPDPWHRAVKKATQGSAGLPVNVQVVCKPWQEEQVLRLMKEIDDACQTQK